MTNGRSANPRQQSGPRTKACEHPTARAGWATASISSRIVALLLLALTTVLGSGPIAYAADSGPTVKVFVVPTNGRTVTLTSIAESTLSDGGRAEEIFDLNVGQAQSDGGALTRADDELQPGWILRLPADATGPDVRLARDTSQNTDPPSGSGSVNDEQAPTATAQGSVTIPLQLLAAGLTAILLALITVGIVIRHRVRAAWRSLARSLDRLREPARMRKRLALRRSITETFAADDKTVRHAYTTMDHFAARLGRPEPSVHALQVNKQGVTAWLTSTDALEAPWTKLDGIRWQRAAGATTSNDSPSITAAIQPCLIRAGLDPDGAPVFVDLTRLDGALSVTGSPDVARQVLENVLQEIGRTWPGLPVTLLTGLGNIPPVTIPSTFGEITKVPAGSKASPDAPVVAARGAVRAVAARRPVRGVAVLAGSPNQQQTAELETLCNLGWTGLVCGEMDGAHWRWEVDDNGGLRIPVLDLTLMAPA